MSEVPLYSDPKAGASFSVGCAKAAVFRGVGCRV